MQNKCVITPSLATLTSWRAWSSTTGRYVGLTSAVVITRRIRRSVVINIPPVDGFNIAR